jgi:heme-degrading monooxygenase HmoA
MISATFIFTKKQYDEEFDLLDGRIAAAVEANPEYRGKESWTNDEKGQRCVVYYFETRAGLEALRTMAVHKQAKGQYSKWYGGYHVVIAEVLESYGDGAFEHPTPNDLYR